MPYAIGELAGALVPTFLVSRLLLWLTKNWHGGALRLLLVHIVTAAIACTISAFGHADGGPLNWASSDVYLLAQAVWLAVDFYRERGKRQSNTANLPE